MEQIQVARSFIAAGALADIVTENYDIGDSLSCKMFSKLLRTQDNDHYRVMTGDQKYVLRVYEQGDAMEREEADYLFELDWLLYLKENGVPVASPIPRKDGSLLGSVNAPEGQRYYALFTFAKGRQMSLKNQDQLYEFGVNMARIHKIANDYRSPHTRKAIDMACLLDKPLERIKRSWGPQRAANLDILLESAEEARNEVISLLGEHPEPNGDIWGFVGGDFSHMSVHFNNGQPTFFNFDRCGLSWRAYDIAAFLSNSNLLQTSEGYTEAFFAGYYSVRPLASEEHAAVSPFLTLRRIWRMGLFALNSRLAGYTFMAPA
ncbi:MAG: phosphotransferase [Candidatus Promineifilaceae bacterium]|nr:phosphotransferase [Candidatus Promineifilaceae bacterium]